MPPSMLSIWCSYSYPSVNCSFLFFLNPQNWLGWFGLNFLLNTKPNQLCMPLKRLRVKHPIFVNFKKIDRFIFSTEFHEPKPPFKEWKKNVSRRNLYAHNQKSKKKKKGETCIFHTKLVRLLYIPHQSHIRRFLLQVEQASNTHNRIHSSL